MVPYVVKQGDYLAKLAFHMGFDADEVWGDPSNAELRELRKNPNVLCPGDILHVPELRTRPKLPLGAGADNHFACDVPKVEVRLLLRFGGKPAAGERFVVKGLAEPIEDRAGPDGLVRFEVPAHLARVDVELPDRNEIQPVLIGYLDPETTRSGAAGRLASLGYFGLYWTDELLRDEEYLARALRAFQADHAKDYGLTPTGALDGATSAALKAVHGS